MYLTYDEYIDMGGTELEEATFQQLEFEARSVIDWWTFNRLQKDDTYPEAVKRCMLKLIQLINTKQQALIVDSQSADGSVKAGITHEANDGVSTYYNTLSAKEAVDSIKNELGTTVQMYLAGVRNSLGHKLLYRGIYSDE